ncbi:MAG: hypothetical protein R2825_17005 [Saprospiraceae bacterium]
MPSICSALQRFQRGGVGLQTDTAPLKPLEEHFGTLPNAIITLLRILRTTTFTV